MASDESLVNYGLGAIRDARLDIALDDYASSSFFNLANVNFAAFSVTLSQSATRLQIVCRHSNETIVYKQSHYRRFFYRNNLRDILNYFYNYNVSSILKKFLLNVLNVIEGI